MANPNIVNVSIINGKTYSNVLTTSNVLHVVNGASSGNIYKINSIVVSNVGASATSATIEINTAAGSGTPYRLVYGVSVPATSTLIVTDKATSFYLEENSSIKGFASSNSALEMIISYDLIG